MEFHTQHQMLAFSDAQNISDEIFHHFFLLSNVYTSNAYYSTRELLYELEQKRTQLLGNEPNRTGTKKKKTNTLAEKQHLSRNVPEEYQVERYAFISAWNWASKQFFPKCLLLGIPTVRKVFVFCPFPFISKSSTLILVFRK